MSITKSEYILLFTIFVITILRLVFFAPTVPSNFERAVGAKVSFIGNVNDTPDVRQNFTQINVEPKDYDFNILLRTLPDQEISYGDNVKVFGTLKYPENFTTNTGKEFDYISYLKRQNVFYIVDKPSIKIIDSDGGNFLKAFLFKIRNNFENSINNLFSNDESALANGILLGSRGGFDNNLRNEFVRTGTIHIIALSGYNVSVVANAVMKFFNSFLSINISAIFGGITIILFVIMTGASSTAIRAGIMGVITLIAKITGRPYLAIRALFVAGIVMILYDPQTLFDISFQLSFLATIGVISLSPKIIKYFSFIPIRFGFREMVATTMGAIIMTMPLIVYTMGTLSIVALPANILILSLIPLTMFMAFVSGLFGIFSHILALPFSYLTHLLLKYILTIIHFFSSLSFASFNISYIPLIVIILIYIFLFYWIFRKNETQNTKYPKIKF